MIYSTVPYIFILSAVSYLKTEFILVPVGKSVVFKGTSMEKLMALLRLSCCTSHDHIVFLTS